MTTETYMMYTIVTIFVIVGAFIPFVNDAAGVDVTNTDTQQIVTDVGEDTGFSLVDDVFRVVLSIFTIFFWSFEVPASVNIIIFTPLRITLGYLIYLAVRR